MNRILHLLALALACTGLLASCSTSVDMPKGKRGTYQSVRLIQRNPNLPAPTNATEKQVHSMIQKSLQRQFTSRGMTYGNGNAELAVAYMVIYQQPGMTATYDDYFGYGRNSREIGDVAHIRGSLESKRPDFFRQVGIVVDVVDLQTGKLIFRNFAKGDVVEGTPPATRAQRIDQAIAQSLAPFFQ